MPDTFFFPPSQLAKKFYFSEQKQNFNVLFMTPDGNTVLRQFQLLHL